MVTQSAIATFLDQHKLAIIGVSRDTKQIANSAYRVLKARGYQVYPVNPFTKIVEGERCYPNLTSLPEKVDGVLVVLPPEKTMSVLPEILNAGITNIWLQQNSESEQSIHFCENQNINVVYGECILMYCKPLGLPCRMHRWVKKITGNFPTE